MNVLMISPAYPGEMPLFTRALAAVGARVIGLSDHPESSLPARLRQVLSGHVHVRSLWQEGAVVEKVCRKLGRVRIDRVECLWEPGMILAARLREALELPGLTVEQTLPFRDKERMKQRLDETGVRTPRHAAARSVKECREAAERIGFPLIVKPIAGGGSADTHRVDEPAQLDEVLTWLRHVPEVSVEEFIDGEELTYDTICAAGQVLYDNVAWYRPRPLEEKQDERLSPQTICLRQLESVEIQGGREMGRRVLQVLGFDSGFSHMEWFRKPDGEVVFGEIGARPPGARLVDIMNYASDVDLFIGWAEGVCHQRFTQPVERKYNAAMICKRAQGRGRIRRIEGLESLQRELGEQIVCVDLLPVGAPRRNWKMTSIADGFVIVRHPDLDTTLRLADRIGQELQLFAE